MVQKMTQFSADGAPLLTVQSLAPGAYHRPEPRPMEIRTSKTHPIEVAWISIGRGAIGLTFAPGKRAASKTHDILWFRSLATDIRRLERERATRLVCLVETHELDAMRIPHLARMSEKRGIAFTHFPIRDAGVPTSIKATRKLVRSIAREVRTGGRVVIHCAGGLGRTGTIAGCVLIELGRSPIDALEELVSARGPRCPETFTQIDFVVAWALERRQ